MPTGTARGRHRPLVGGMLAAVAAVLGWRDEGLGSEVGMCAGRGAVRRAGSSRAGPARGCADHGDGAAAAPATEALADLEAVGAIRPFSPLGHPDDQAVYP